MLVAKNRTIDCHYLYWILMHNLFNSAFSPHYVLLLLKCNHFCENLLKLL